MISEKTAVSMGLVITLLGGVAFITSIYNQSIANASDIQELKSSISYKIDRIENKLDYIIERLPRQSR
jgi:hypothetical protein